MTRRNNIGVERDKCDRNDVHRVVRVTSRHESERQIDHNTKSFSRPNLVTIILAAPSQNRGCTCEVGAGTIVDIDAASTHAEFLTEPHCPWTRARLVVT